MTRLHGAPFARGGVLPPNRPFARRQVARRRWIRLEDRVRAGEVSAGPAAGRGYASDAGRRVHRRANAEGLRTQNSVGGAETRSQSSVGESGITGESRQGLAFLTQVFHWGVWSPQGRSAPPEHRNAFLGRGTGYGIGGGTWGDGAVARRVRRQVIRNKFEVERARARARARGAAGRLRAPRAAVERVCFAPKLAARRAKVARGRAGRGAGNRLSVIMR